MEELNIMNQPKNETIVKKYLSHYRHSPQSIKMRKSSLTYFFAEDFFNYHDHIFNINTQVLIDYFDFLKNLDSIGGATKKNKWHIMKSFLEFTMEYYRKHNFIVIIPSKTINWNGSIPKKTKVRSNKKVIATLEEVEKITILKTLDAAGGNKSETARRLGITRRTLHKKLKKYGVMS